MLNFPPENLVELLESFKSLDSTKNDALVVEQIDAIIEIIRNAPIVKTKEESIIVEKRIVAVIKMIGIEILKHEAIELIIKAVEEALKN